jgi:hypothetical protein
MLTYRYSGSATHPSQRRIIYTSYSKWNDMMDGV